MADLLKLRTLIRAPTPFVPTSAKTRAPLTPSAPAIRKPLDTFTASPAKTLVGKLLDSSFAQPTRPPPVGTGGKESSGSAPRTLDIRRYEAVQRQEPQREDFDDAREYSAAHAAWERKLLTLVDAAGEDYLVDIKKQAQETPTGNAIVDAAREAGVEVVVLPDDEYARRYPNSDGVTDGGVVYVPTRSIDNPSDSQNVDVVVHEYVHALLGGKLDPNTWQLVRPFVAAQAFSELGLPPEAGAEIARQTSGWEDNVAVEHAVTAYVTRRMEREREGLPPESPAEEAAAIQRISDRELALHLQRANLGDSPPSDAEIVEQWESSPTGQRHPPEGDTVEEKAAWIEAQLPTFADEAYVD